MSHLALLIRYWRTDPITNQDAIIHADMVHLNSGDDGSRFNHNTPLDIIQKLGSQYSSHDWDTVTAEFVYCDRAIDELLRMTQHI